MRKWYKYFLVSGETENKIIKKHENFSDYETAMGGYEVNDHYKSSKSFNLEYLTGRFQYNHKYLKNNLDNRMKILSIASGRCINELQFIFNKYNITCSDLNIPKSHKHAKKIFGEFDYQELNILKSPSGEKYNCIIALSLIYSFSEENFKTFFDNINKSLDMNGELILESSSSENNILTFLYDQFYLKYETFIISKIFNLFGKTNSVASRHHGYKFKDKEIVKIAKSNGFELIEIKKKDYMTEILRSKILRNLVKKIPITKYLLLIFGIFMPYLRFFKFKKIKNNII